MRVLFVMGYPGYLRYYDSTVEELAERGHEVHVYFEQPHKQAEGLEALRESGERVVIGGATPRILPASDSVARGLRRFADFVRYLDPSFADAHYLRERMAKLLPDPFRALGRLPVLPGPVARGLLRLCLFLEGGIPIRAEVREFVASIDPDILVVTPLITPSSRQPDLVRAAKLQGIPTVLGVASWDHLSSKGPIRVVPDMVAVWNETQREEACSLHRIDPQRVVVTGAQPWDRWFERRPSTDRRAFCEKVGLPAKPFLLFVGSTASISAPDAEQQFVREWIAAIRRSRVPEVRDISILVRPHPYNRGLWDEADLSDLGDVAVWPRGGANPVDEGDRSEYFDSMFHSVSVVGINTSAMIESAITGRSVFTIRSPLFADSQGGTMHFQYLLPENGGFVRVARSLDEHVAQLEATIRDPEGSSLELRRFLASFVRPNGLERPCTPILVDAIEELTARGRPAPEPMALSRYPVLAGLEVAQAALLAKDPFQRAKSILRVAPAARRRLTSIGDAAEACCRRSGSDSIARAGAAVNRRVDDGATALELRLATTGQRMRIKAKNDARAKRENAPHAAARKRPATGEEPVLTASRETRA